MSDIKVIIIKLLHNWGIEIPFELIPKGCAEADGLKFIDGNVDDITEYDYLIVLNNPPIAQQATHQQGRLWCMIGEPDDPACHHLHHKRHEYDRIYGCSEQQANKQLNYQLSLPVLPIFHIKKTYDFLINSSNVPKKTKPLSWITSNFKNLAGHRYRMQFLERLKNSGIQFDLYGKGFNFIEDKWDGLASYKYSIAFENSHKKYYWTEKIGDIFAAECMPIYFGCKNIYDYFPRESLVHIDSKDPEVFNKIQEVIESDLYLQRRDAILEAKKLCLNKYNCFKFIADEVSQQQYTNPQVAEIKTHLKKVTPSMLQKISTKLNKLLHHINLTI